MATAAGRAEYPMIFEQDWEALGYVGFPYERLYPRLEGEVHDLFRYKPDGKCMETWFKQLPEQYRVINETLDSVFRLAKNILLSPASLNWFYYLIYSPRRLTDPPIQENGDDVYVYRRDDTPMETRHEMARAALQRLAMTHTIALEDVDEDEHNDEGRTEPKTDFFEQGINIKNDLFTPSSVRAYIVMSRVFVHGLMGMCMEGIRSYAEMQVMGLKMAVSFIHEIAHAATMGCSPRRLENVKKEISLRANAAAKKVKRKSELPNVNEDLFEDENVAEAGYSWENFVFGGIIELLDCNPTNPLLVIKWPNFLKGDGDLRKGGWKPSATQYIVPMQYILNMKSQKWWNSVEKKDTTALYIKKTIGIRVRCPERYDIDLELNPSDNSDSTWPTDEDLSRGRTKSKRVSRERPGVRIDDPSNARANEFAS